MKTTVIICEFNPLHSGHKRLIEHARTFSDKTICVMSGNFTQRGMPACADKYSRAAHAISAGADLVVELPTIFATASAENFAYGAVKAAARLKADYILFGSECGNIDLLKQCARKMLDKQVNERIAAEVGKGVSYPKAVAKALNMDVFDKPNNVLAIEYLKVIEKYNYKITPVTLKREDNYNGEPQEYASSAALRNNPSLRKKFTYDYVWNDMNDNVENAYCNLAPSILALKTIQELQQIEGVTEGLENRIFKADKTCGFEKMIAEIKTKRYTRLKIQRIILNAILDIKKDDVTQAKCRDVSLVALAVRSKEAALLKLVDNIADAPQKADRLYNTISEKRRPAKLVKIG